MSDTQRVKDLFDLPESIHRIGFVEVLSEAVTRPETTAETYVVTDRIANAFDKSLALIGSSLKSNRSQAAFLHGSFGSGKSHFMALLSLLLDANEHAWRIPELHRLRKKHKYIGNKKLLQLHFHMVGAGTVEEKIFRRYINFVRETHPEAKLPGLFADEKLFDDAYRMLDELGDEAFFAPMNEGVEGGADDDGDWGELDEDATWKRNKFERAVASIDPKEREELFNALVKTRFSSYADESRQYKDLDEGLAIVGRHAASLGYDAVVLFLDELILWLASRASDVSWFHNEVQKLVKLVESQESEREIPFVSFIARQRDLAEMVGETYAGVENARLRDSLKWSEGRYETITLEDRDLPAIAEKRVLRPKNDIAKKGLKKAFDQMKRAAGDKAWSTMLGKLDATEFRRLYPFSPVLVEGLVALSNSLQRERTAIKLLTEILIEHIEDLQVGEVIRVGDLYDVLAGGDDTADGVMRSRFESAKQLYNFQFLPIIQKAYGTDSPEKCQRLRDGHPARLGCSNCPEAGCRADNRLVKTLLIGALVPEVETLKDMTASRLVQLNHGSLKVPIPGTEASLAAQKIKGWASQMGQLHVGSQADPTVRVRLEGVELDPIIEQGRHVDSPGARQRVIKDILFEALGIETITDWGRDHVEEWRGTRRIGHVRFGNVRRMGKEALRCPENHYWRLIVDYPFDEPGFGPREDEEALEKFVEETGGSWTLVWMPTFFSKQVTDMLGDVVVLRHILESHTTTMGYVSHLSVENQSRAINDLENLKTQKESRVCQVLEQAYGLARAREGDLDDALTPERHLAVLKPGVQILPNAAANLASALSGFVPALLEARYPRHPRFAKRFTPNRVEELVRRFGDIVDSEDKRIPADKAIVEEMRGTLAELGLVRTTETAVHLMEDRMLQTVENRRRQEAVEQPNVGEIRRWVDPDGQMGLQSEAMDLVVRCYARAFARTFVQVGQPYEPKAGKTMPDDVALEKPDLPTPTQWQAALCLASDALGETFAGRALHADNLKKFEALVGAKLKKVSKACASLPGSLGRWAAQLEVNADCDRIRTASCADELCALLAGKDGKGIVEALAAFEAQTSARAVGSSVGAATELTTLLDNPLVFGQFEQITGRQAELVGATELLEKVATAIRQDEINVQLGSRIRTLAEEALKLLTVNKMEPPPEPGTVVLANPSLKSKGKASVMQQLRDAVAAIETALEKAEDDVTLNGSLKLTGKKKT